MTETTDTLTAELTALRAERDALVKDVERAKVGWDSAFRQAMANGELANSLRARVAELERGLPDGERYRWLRDNFTCVTPTVRVGWTLELGSKPLAPTTEQEIDAAIDAAIKRDERKED